MRLTSKSAPVYNGVAAKIVSVASLHVHAWCYSHSLNLLLTDAGSSTTAATTLFGDVQSKQGEDVPEDWYR